MINKKILNYFEQRSVNQSIITVKKKVMKNVYTFLKLRKLLHSFLYLKNKFTKKNIK